MQKNRSFMGYRRRERSISGVVVRARESAHACIVDRKGIGPCLAYKKQPSADRHTANRYKPNSALPTSGRLSNESPNVAAPVARADVLSPRLGFTEGPREISESRDRRSRSEAAARGTSTGGLLRLSRQLAFELLLGG